ncbi:MAG TPA: hypothetical protein PKZ32_18895 [Candidatus Melainabacteria bacterium]|nr:hypothetical protein [Candidatus Melainabacteria bacterium]
MSEDMGESFEQNTGAGAPVNYGPLLVKALQTSGALTLQQEAQLQVAFSKAGDTPGEQVFLESGIFTPKQVTGLGKTLSLLEQQRITIETVATCLSTMLGTFSTLEAALTEVEYNAVPEGQTVYS